MLCAVSNEPKKSPLFCCAGALVSAAFCDELDSKLPKKLFELPWLAGAEDRADSAAAVVATDDVAVSKLPKPLLLLLAVLAVL